MSSLAAVAGTTSLVRAMDAAAPLALANQLLLPMIVKRGRSSLHVSGAK